MDISQFPLAWRWTDEQYAVLPADVLAQIVPQTPGQAKSLFAESLALTDNDGLSPALFTITQTATELADPAQITAWLLYLSWQPNTAVFAHWVSLQSTGMSFAIACGSSLGAALPPFGVHATWALPLTAG
jgi:hypothetical protein